MNALPLVGESAKLAIISYLVYLVRKEEVEQIYFLLVQYVADSCPISKNLGDTTKFPANIQKE